MGDSTKSWDGDSTARRRTGPDQRLRFNANNRLGNDYREPAALISGGWFGDRVSGRTLGSGDAIQCPTVGDDVVPIGKFDRAVGHAAGQWAVLLPEQRPRDLQ